MTDRDQWQRNNDEYLAAALDWIRLRLLQMAVRHPLPALGDDAPHGMFARLLRPAAATTLPTSAPSDKDVSRARAAMDACAQPDRLPAALLLQRRFDLSDFELDTLLFCTALELDTRIAGLCARAHDDPSKPYPTWALALALFPEPTWDALSPHRPLRFWRLIETSQPAATPLTASPLRADERVVNYLKGLNQLDDGLATFLTLLRAPGDRAAWALPPTHQAIATNLAEGLTAGAIPDVIHLVGAESAGKQQIASDVASKLSMALYLMPSVVLPTAPLELETLARTWRRDCMLLPICLYIDASDAERDALPVTRWLSRSGGLVFLDTRDSWRNLRRAALTVDVDRPTRAEQRELWRTLVNDDGLAGVLASQFHLSVPDIHRAATSAKHGKEDTVEGRIWTACRAASRPRLDLLAERLDARATWDDLVLPDQETASLREIATHARRRALVHEDWGFSQRMNRGLGLSALFAGESGTGKTMAAEVIANELNLNLYRIDLSAVVSKYIGETEKNLRQLFDAAEDGGTILFFDEADALFGKRSEVKDSHDRYANIEINYLLQRMESYAGLAILATNLKNALDPAFLRRLRFILRFPFPSAQERRRIWQRAFPPAVPVGPLDLDFLARLNVAGGTVSNIALRAAFLAAGRREPVTMDIVLEAARGEFRKLERPVNDVDFAWTPRKTEAVA